MYTKTLALLCLVAGADAFSAAVPGTQVSTPPVAEEVAHAAAPEVEAPAVQEVTQAPVTENPTVQAFAPPPPPMNILSTYGGTMTNQRYDTIDPNSVYATWPNRNRQGSPIQMEEGRINSGGPMQAGDMGGNLSDRRYDMISPDSIYGSATESKF